MNRSAATVKSTVVLVLFCLFPFHVGCHVPAVAIIVVAGKLTAVKAGAAVLSLAAAYYTVEAAYYDKETKRLELDAVKQGKKIKIIVKDLTEKQISTILSKGTIEIQFKDGSTETVRVRMK